VSRSDWYGIGVTLLLGAVGYFIGGLYTALAALLIGLIIIFVARITGTTERATSSPTTTLGDISKAAVPQLRMVELSVAGYGVVPTTFVFQAGTKRYNLPSGIVDVAPTPWTEIAHTALITFANRSSISATRIAAKIKYFDADGKTMTLSGRWADTDQPEPDYRKSVNHLLRVDFYPGDEHKLDIAAQFHDGCYAINNDSFRFDALMMKERFLKGPTVKITIQLIGESVDQTFRFELHLNGVLGVART
jgi:hypothetical protein